MVAALIGAATAGLFGAILAWGVQRGGLAVGVVLPAAVIGWWLVRRPGAAFAVLVGSVILFEQDSMGFLPITGEFYRRLPGHLYITDVLLIVVVIAVVIDIGRERERRVVPLALVVPLVVLTAALLFGLVVGKEGGGSGKEILDEARNLVYLVAMPLLALRVLRTARALRATVMVLAILAIVKGFVGLAGWLLGQGRSISGTHLTYYDPAANFVMLLFLAMVVAARMTRLRLPLWMWAGVPFALLSLLLSFRRSFWIAGVLALVLVVVVASDRRTRPLVVLGIVALVVAGGLAASSVGSGGVQGTSTSSSSSGIGARLSSLTPSAVSASNDDRYRLDEIQNVAHAIEGHPVTGLGIGVPWTEVYPLSETHAGGMLYTHVTLLWFLLKLGPLGAVGYLLWYLGAILLGYRGWRRSPDPMVRVACLGSIVSLAGLAVADLTASFTGVDPRLTVVVATLVGFLGAAGGRLPAPEPERADVAVSSTSLPSNVG